MAKNKRARTKYPALKPELNLKSRYELIDYDYINSLSDQEKKWLNQFTEEYVNASLDTNMLDNNLHNTDNLKKDCYRRNNARNRDILTRAKASGNHISTDELLLNNKAIKMDNEEELLNKIDDSLGDLKKPGTWSNNHRNNTDCF